MRGPDGGAGRGWAGMPRVRSGSETGGTRLEALQMQSLSRGSLKSQDLGRFTARQRSPGMRNTWVPLCLKALPSFLVFRVFGSHHRARNPKCLCTLHSTPPPNLSHSEVTSRASGPARCGGNSGTKAAHGADLK